MYDLLVLKTAALQGLPCTFCCKYGSKYQNPGIAQMIREGIATS